MKIRRLRVQNPRRIRKRPINVLASVMTTLNLYFGTMSIFASIGQEFETAAIYILIGIIFDGLDGTVARLTRSTSEFGKELDSLADIVTFGVAPAVLLFTSYLPHATMLEVSERATSIVGKTGSYTAIVFVICAALRLARFNTYQAERRDSFVGLPSPAAGGTLAAFVLFLQYFEPELATQEHGVLAYYALAPVSIILALLMVSTVSYPKDRLKSFVVAPRHAFMSLATMAFVIGFVIHYAREYSWSIVLFPLAMTYVIYGMAATGYVRYRRHHRAERTARNLAAMGQAPAADETTPPKSQAESR